MFRGNDEAFAAPVAVGGMGIPQDPTQVMGGFGDGPGLGGGTPQMQSGFGDSGQAGFMLTERVRAYIIDFYMKMCENNTSDVRYLYFREWTSLTNNYYKDTEWPNENEISSLVDENEVFIHCYKELYYRHIFVHGSPLLHHRVESWENYKALFDMFLDGANTSSLQLPLEWLGDMIDEFLYQFEDFCSYRHKLTRLSEEELETLENQPDVWNVHMVLGYLTSFVDRSGIVKMLNDPNKQVGNRLSVLESLGYYSLIGLCRVHCLTGDYRLALQQLNPIDVDDKRALFTRIASTHLSLYYYLGFAYMMMKRYADAVNVFSTVLLAHRGSRGRATCFSDGQINSKYDKIRALCAMSVALSPGLALDEQVRQLLMEKYDEVMPRLMQRREENFEELFRYGCPKFITPSTPNYSNLEDRHREAYNLQLKWFLTEVRSQATLPEIRSYLKLYTSIPIMKLSQFCDLSDEVFIEKLMSIKHKSYQLVNPRNGSPALDGIRSCATDVHFYMSEDMLHVDETGRVQRFSEYFMTHSLKFQTAIDDLRSTDPRRRHHQKKKHNDRKQ
uniref:Eukaryotic translation initiation factor 3 subunit L n=1 Tax=Aplanochytrium stocchinoi TaxID=215587 RepID=A0A7S3UZP3_9STRA